MYDILPVTVIKRKVRPQKADEPLLFEKAIFRLPRNRQMLGNRITARLCACRYAEQQGCCVVIAKGRHGCRPISDDELTDADGGLSTARFLLLQPKAYR